MDREKILQFINKIIKEEHGKAVTESNLLTDSGIDSFGYAIFWCSIEDKYGIKFGKEESMKLNYLTLTIGEIISTVIVKSESNVCS